METKDSMRIQLQGSGVTSVVTYSVDELQDLIDEMNLAIPGLDSNELDISPFLRCVAVLTEIKIAQKVQC